MAAGKLIPTNINWCSHPKGKPCGKSMEWLRSAPRERSTHLIALQHCLARRFLACCASLVSRSQFNRDLLNLFFSYRSSLFSCRSGFVDSAELKRQLLNLLFSHRSSLFSCRSGFVDSAELKRQLLNPFLSRQLPKFVFVSEVPAPVDQYRMFSQEREPLANCRDTHR